jgi:dihydroorotate dehydrogenase
VPLDLERPYFISPPFGRYLRAKNAYSVTGSYTTEPRPGRLQRVLRTLRPVPSDDGPAWINKIGLRNPGIEALPIHAKKQRHNARLIPPIPPPAIVSIALIADNDWLVFVRWLEFFDPNCIPLIEVNVSCPNIDIPRSLVPPKRLLARMLLVQPDLIFKLPPLEPSIETAINLYDNGVQYIHLSNTYPTPVGGLSGAPLRNINLPLVEELAHTLPSLNIIGGGGIIDWGDVASYRNAGARWFSLSSVFFRLRRGFNLLKYDPRI